MPEKIGIITAHLWNNYGSVLQVYALSTHLQKHGYYVEVVNYDPNFNKNILFRIVSIWRSFGFTRLMRKILLTIRDLISNPKHQISENISGLYDNEMFSVFRNTHLNVSKTTCHLNSLKIIVQNYDVFIAGSDNIWDGVQNFQSLNTSNSPYFLTFVPKEKIRIAYAPSLGEPKVNTEMYPLIRSLLNNLDHISVRGKSTAKVLSTICNKAIPAVVDPTMLLTAEEWNLIAATGKIQLPYILVYIIYPLDRTSEIFSWITKLSEKSGMPIKHIGFHYSAKGDVLYETVEVVEFLALFRDAAKVITNSFHGTIFSIIYQKEFYTFPPRDAPTRITDLLASVGLPERYVTTAKDAELLSSIPWNHTEEKVIHLRTNSMAWLDNAIRNGKRKNDSP